MHGKVCKSRMKTRIARSIALCLVLALLMAVIPVAADETSSAENVSSGREDGYEAYIAQMKQQHPDAGYPDTEVVVEGAQYAEASDDTTTVSDYEGMAGEAVSTTADGSVTWKFTVEQAGFYMLKMEYFIPEGTGSDVERTLYLNPDDFKENPDDEDAPPFYNANYFSFGRQWRNEMEREGNASYVWERDLRDNDLRPTQVEVRQWRTDYFVDYLGFQAAPYYFYLKEGENELTLAATREPLIIRRLVFCQKEGVPTYADVLAQYEAAGYTKVTGTDAEITIQGEDADLKSDITLYPISDRSSPTTVPYSVSKTRLNSVGGSNWKMPYSQLTWNVEVKQSGLYRLGIKYRQNTSRGQYVNRTLLIDGEVPFAEAQKLSFEYGSDWQNIIAGGEDCYIYLSEGKHAITLEVTLGDLADILNRANDSVYQLNYAYRQMLMVLGSTPDAYRDYELTKKVPEAIEILDQQAKALQSIMDDIVNLTGHSGSSTSALNTMIVQLNALYADPDTKIQRQWTSFAANISAVAAWVLSTKEQPLEIDYLTLMTEDSELPKASANFFQWLWHETRSLVASFFEDYTSIGNVEKDALTIWVQTGRDQAQIIKNMIDNDFTPESGIGINVRNVAQGVLLSAVVAGQEPDMALQNPVSNPVNYAIRGALYDLNSFADSDEVFSQFRESAILPYRYNGGIYGLPETQTFPMMYYREDILAELGLEPPTTWDEFFDILPTIQKNNMDVCIGSTVTSLVGYAMFLFQNGGQFYVDDGVKSDLQTEAAVSAFETWTGLYTNYKLSITYDFANRFRTGEMPIGIADYSVYSYLSIFAPEIRGLWSFCTVPGTVQSDGSVNNQVPSSGTAAVMLSTTSNPDDCWEFLKWWGSSETQLQYAKELESLLGIAGRYTPANVETMQGMSWSTEELNSITAQWEQARGIPEVPGGYFTSRHLDNAFRRVVNQNEEPRETLLDYVLYIDNELESKRIEFNLNTADEQ